MNSVHAPLQHEQRASRDQRSSRGVFGRKHFWHPWLAVKAPKAAGMARKSNLTKQLQLTLKFAEAVADNDFNGDE
jgi:hypothetical protein